MIATRFVVYNDLYLSKHLSHLNFYMVLRPEIWSSPLGQTRPTTLYAHQSHLMCRLLSEKKLYCHCIVTSALLRYHVLGVWGPCLYRDWLFWPYSGQLDLFLCVTISTDPCDCVSVLLNKTDWCCSIKICVPSSRRDEIWQFLQLDENCILTRATTIMISVNFPI